MPHRPYCSSNVPFSDCSIAAELKRKFGKCGKLLPFRVLPLGISVQLGPKMIESSFVDMYSGCQPQLGRPVCRECIVPICLRWGGRLAQTETCLRQFPSRIEGAGKEDIDRPPGLPIVLGSGRRTVKSAQVGGQARADYRYSN